MCCVPDALSYEENFALKTKDRMLENRVMWRIFGQQ